VAVDIAATALKVGETSSVTFTFSEAPQGFELGDIASAQGSFSGLTATGNPLVWTATFTPTANIENTATVTVTAGSYTDVAGNLGTAGSDTTLVDTTIQITAKISVDQSFVSEKGGELTYRVELVDQHGNTVTVPNGKSIEVKLDWFGVAANNTDTIGRPESVTITNGSETSFKVATFEDQIFESHEELRVSVSEVVGAATAIENGVNGTQGSSATSTIYDNDVAVNVPMPAPQNIGLTISTWVYTSGSSAINTQLNILKNSGSLGNGANANVLESAIKELDKYTPNGDLKIENGQRKHGYGGGNTGDQIVQDLISKNPNSTDPNAQQNVKEGTAVHAHGIIFLQAGQTYVVQAAGDDSLRVVLGDRSNGGQVVDLSWGADGTTSKTFTFTATESGLYTFDMYMHNQSGAGMYNVSVVNQTTPSETTPFFPNFDAAVNQVLGQNDQFSIGSLIGSENQGHYRVYGYNEGEQDSEIALTEIETNGLEAGAEIRLEGVPIGFTLSDGTGNTFIASAGNTIANIISWDTKSLILTPANGISGTYDLKVVIRETNNPEFDRVHTIHVRIDSIPTAPDAVDDNIITNILDSIITIDSAVLLANDDRGTAPQNLESVTINTEWAGTGLTAQSQQTKSFDGTGASNNKTNTNSNLTIARADFHKDETSSTAELEIKGYLRRSSGGTDYRDEDWITVTLKKGEKLTLDHNRLDSEIQMRWHIGKTEATNGTLIRDGESIIATQDGAYQIYLKNPGSGRVSDRYYDLTMKSTTATLILRMHKVPTPSQAQRAAIQQT
jgi:hypothetical protein